MESRYLRDNAELVHDEIGEWAVCAACYPETTAEEIALTASLRNKSMMVSTARDVRDRGFDVVPDPEEGPVHALILLPVDSSAAPSEGEWEEVWEDLRSCFEEPVQNPAYPT